MSQGEAASQHEPPRVFTLDEAADFCEFGALAVAFISCQVVVLVSGGVLGSGGGN